MIKFILVKKVIMFMKKTIYIDYV